MPTTATPPKLDIGPKAPLLRHRVVSIDLVNFFNAKVATSSHESGRGRVTSRRAQDQFMHNSDDYNNEYSEDTLKEVVRTKFSTNLMESYSYPG